ncbi:MAG: type 11 methyltransferase [Ignavibacteria bacterium]|nr:MAG: type 11 methyltransferase [Ignavibacteria bacterium]KAF0160972.1 MAG: type 11 methyltransferase [Ignavibacteria bacterium]
MCANKKRGFLNTDNHWERFGKIDPYFGVISHDEYHKSNINDEIKKKFFETGDEYIKKLFSNIYKHIDPDFNPKMALDYGCGVGRVIIPLSKYTDFVTGVDVSKSMLEECRINCEQNNIVNYRLVEANHEFFRDSEKHDFIHSFIVFQHIPKRRGELIFSSLIDRLTDKGIGVLHFTFAKKTIVRKILELIRNNVPLISNIINLLKRRHILYPVMQMNSYDLNKLLGVLQKNGIKDTYIEFTDHGSDVGVLIYFQKT